MIYKERGLAKLTKGGRLEEDDVAVETIVERFERRVSVYDACVVLGSTHVVVDQAGRDALFAIWFSHV